MEQEATERPRKRSGSEKRRMSHTVHVRLSPASHARLSARADAERITLAAWLRKLADDAPVSRQSRKPAPDRALLIRWLAATGHIGGNINQLAHAANVGGFEAVRRGLLEQAIQDVAEIRAMLMKALGYAPILTDAVDREGEPP
jgi:Bacterial mobilisation protein (MobC)/HicB family